MVRIARYKHQPLNTGRGQIRLVRIERAQSDEPLTLHVETFDLENAPPYSALSYTWGSAASTYRIRVDGMWLDVRKNLYQFLREFRREPGQSQWLWIDQISIDQANASERNHQVRFMSSIYTQCDSVTVWLNDDEGLCSSAARNFVSFQDPASLADLLRNEYFSRLWVVQEVLLAQHVRFLTPGNLWISWDAIQETVERTAVSYFRKLDLGTSSAMSLLALSGERLARSLDWCILKFSGNKCEEPLDKIYGFLGLIDPSYHFDVDYSRPKLEIYRNAVRYSSEGNRSDVAQILGRNMGIADLEVAKLVRPVERIRLFLPKARPRWCRDSRTKSVDLVNPRRSLILEPGPQAAQRPLQKRCTQETEERQLPPVPRPRWSILLESIPSLTKFESFATQQDLTRRKFVHRKGAVAAGDGTLHESLASLAHKTWTRLGLN